MKFPGGRIFVSKRSFGGGRISDSKWDSFDEAGDGEGVADAALAADQAQDAAFTGQLMEMRTSVENAGAVESAGCRSGWDDHFVSRRPLITDCRASWRLVGGLRRCSPAVNLKDRKYHPQFANV